MWVSLGGVFLVGAPTAAPSLAAPTSQSYTASFPMEKTFKRTCPAGFPAVDFCFTGSDHSGLGTSTPPGSTATEDFAGFVDFTSPIANACLTPPTFLLRTSPGFSDHNLVTLGTSQGRLFLRTDGTDCTTTGTDDGAWKVLGGTGVFEGATGSGTVHTQATGGDGSQGHPITSFSTYTGSVTLRGGD